MKHVTSSMWSAKGKIPCKSIGLKKTTKNLNWIAEKSKYLLTLKTKDNNTTISCFVLSLIPCEICSSKIWAFGISTTYGRAGGCKKAVADQSTEHICYRLYLWCTPRQVSERMYVFSLLSLPSLHWKKLYSWTDACAASDNSCIRHNISLLPKTDLLAQCSPVKEVSFCKGNSFNYSWIQDRRMPWGITLTRAVRSQSSQKFWVGFQLF